jgi:hypothetical protein
MQSWFPLHFLPDRLGYKCNLAALRARLPTDPASQFFSAPQGISVAEVTTYWRKSSVAAEDRPIVRLT